MVPLLPLLAWRNRQTRTAQDRMGKPVEVRVLSRALRALSYVQSGGHTNATVNERLFRSFPSGCPTCFHELRKLPSPGRRECASFLGRSCFLARGFPPRRPASLHELGELSSSGRRELAFPLCISRGSRAP